MRLVDWLTGVTPPPADLDRSPPAAARAALLAVDRASAPFLVRDGAPEGVDLVAEWRIVDARWYEVFAKSGLERVFKLLMRFDAAAGEVRAADQEWRRAWRAGVPELSLAADAFRGRKWHIGAGETYAFRQDLSYGEVYRYSFSTDEIRNPLRQAALAAGWGWRPVAFGKL